MLNLMKNNRGFRFATILVIVQFLIMIVIAAFRIGGEEFVANMFNIPAPIYAGIASLAVFWGWKTSKKTEISRHIWGWMALGFFLWTVAELLWIYYTIQYQEAIPYPSPADFFWVVGNIPLLIALVIRIRSFRVALEGRQVLVLVAANAVFIIFSALFIFPPMFVEADAARWLETVINILYTVADLFLFGLSLGIFFLMERGRLSTVWSLILWSNIVRAIADLVFTYVSWNEAILSAEIFYIINYLFNIPYLTAYLIFALGMLANRVFISDVFHDDEPVTVQPETGFDLSLIFTDSQNNVAGASNNFPELVGAENARDLTGQQLHKVLGVDARVIDNMILECKQRGYIITHPVEIRTAGGDQIPAWITATRDGSTAEINNGLNIVLHIKAGNPDLAELNPEFNAIAQRILTETGLTSIENIALLKDYFTVQVMGLNDLVKTLGGKPVADALQDGFNKVAVKNGWDLKFIQQELTIPPDYNEIQLGKAFGLLLQTTREYATDVTNAKVVSEEIRKAEQGMSSRAIRVASDFGLRKT